MTPAVLTMDECRTHVTTMACHVAEASFGDDRGLEVETLESWRVQIRFWGDERADNTFAFQKRTMDVHPSELPALIATLERTRDYLAQSGKWPELASYPR